MPWMTLVNIKKILLSVSVIITFAIYSFQQRHDGTSPIHVTSSSSSKPVQNNPTSLAQNTVISNNQHTTSIKDGIYDGNAADAFYGNIQVQVTIQGGRITDVVFLQYPNDQRNSIEINSQAMPVLKQEA